MDDFKSYGKAKMKVSVVTATQSDGGAAIAALRIFHGVRSTGLAISMNVLVKQTMEEGVFGPKERSVRARIARLFMKLDQRKLLDYPNRAKSPFSPNLSFNPLSPVAGVDANTVLHFHWIAGSVVNLRRFGKIQNPIIWTLHDAWAFTGGCFYTGNCKGYLDCCGSCPLLGSEQDDDLSRKIIQAKRSAFSGKTIVIVAPSNWLAAKARESELFRTKEVIVIPNGINTNKFKPKTPTTVQSQGIRNSEIPVLLCGAQNLKDSRKGYDLFIQAIEMVDFECLLVTFGPKPDWIINNPKVKQQHLGILHSEDQLIDAYRMADVFICPSREDNLPNTVLEAMACGTPCVGFNIGGLSDLVDHKVNGWLAEPFDTRSLIAGVEWVLNNSNTRQPQTEARNKIVDRFEIRNTSKQYCQLYEDVYNRYLAEKP